MARFTRPASQKIAIFLNTATPVEEVQGILENRGLASLFDGVYGSPASKLENLQAIADRLGLQPDEILFVGDGEDDRAAATA